ncbi:MAG: hypothetical protein HYS39_01810 [Proteobacteria bacterium]|nr:hypothetical protein [Pseudomonadota bacterium]
MRNKIYFFALTIILGSFVYGEPSLKTLETPEASTQAKHNQLKKDIEKALQNSKKKSPQVYEDALRVWKNFKTGQSEPHYTYRYWARNLVLWLKDQKKIVFNDQKKVAHVFDILLEKKLISHDAAILLTVDVWGYLVHLQGIPQWDEKKPLNPSEEFIEA